MLLLSGEPAVLDRRRGRHINTEEDARFFKAMQEIAATEHVNLEQEEPSISFYELAARKLSRLDPPLLGRNRGSLSARSVKNRFRRVWSRMKAAEAGYWFDRITDEAGVH